MNSYSEHIDAWALDIAIQYPKSVLKKHINLLLSKVHSEQIKESIKAMVNK